jgi:predicted porin
MQKKVIALAVAGLVSGAAFAQSNVQIYGIADGNFSYSKGDVAKFTGVQSGGWNGSRVGFQGEEGLGNGLKTVFKYEIGLDLDTNTGGLNNTRLAFVGLNGGFGTVSLGRQASPSYGYLGRTSSNDITMVMPTNEVLGTAFKTLSTGGNGRWNNSVAYSSPNMGGFDVRAIYGFGEKVTAKSDATDASKFGLGASYSNGPVYVTAMYETIQKDESAATNVGKVDAWAVGGNYDFKVVKLWANYMNEKDKQTANSEDKDLWSVGLSVPVGSVGTVMFEYTQLNNDLNVGADKKTKGWGIGYKHDLSKRTWLYTSVSQLDNDNWALGGISGTATANDKNTNFQVGIRHGF